MVYIKYENTMLIFFIIIIFVRAFTKFGFNFGNKVSIVSLINTNGPLFFFNYIKEFALECVF